MKALYWILFNGLFVAGIYYGFYLNNEGIIKVMKFWIWFCAVASFFMLFADGDPDNKRPMWFRRLDGIFDFLIVLCLVYFSLLYGILYMAHSIFIQTYLEKCNDVDL